MKISVMLQVSQNQDTADFDLEDLNHDEDSWSLLTEEEKRQCIQVAVHDMPESPYWVVDRFTEDED